VTSERCDVAVVGAGIVGLATTRALIDSHPGLRVVVLEKEPEVGLHQTSHNSGVIHAGIYYRPGSYRARLCVEGVRLMRAFCAERGIRVFECGKVIVAADASELPRLHEIYARGTANGVPGLRMIDPQRLREIEPHVAAVAAIHSPHTAVIDYHDVARALAGELVAAGVQIRTGVAFRAAAPRGGETIVATSRGEIRARGLVTCAGLYADAVARASGVTPDVRVLPFRGEYYLLKPNRRGLVRGCIYPVPNPAFPFLGVHFTPTVHGEVEAGPNAVLGLAREGYSWRHVNARELAEALTFPGLWTMALKYWRTGVYEIQRSFSKRTFVRSLQRLVPEIRDEDVTRGGAGVRAQAITPDGTLADDFQIVQRPGAIHVLNAPSPAATASLAIGRHVAGLAAASFGLASTPG
jgi:L-2-hydroxyglutarate oxidase LhgO